MNLALLQARMGSSRLPGKVLKELNGIPVIQVLINRVSQAKCIDKLAVVTSTNAEDDALENYCKENNIKSLALSGLKKDNKSISLADYSIYVPMKTYGMVECIHQIFLHLILDESMEIFEWDRNEFQNMNSSNFKL